MLWAETIPFPEALTDFGEIFPLRVVASFSFVSAEGVSPRAGFNEFESERSKVTSQTRIRIDPI